MFQQLKISIIWMNLLRKAMKVTKRLNLKITKSIYQRIKDQIKSFLDKFNKDNPDGKLDRAEFMKLYPTLRNEPIENLDEITNMIFRGK